MNLYEKLNRLDDSLVESKRIVKKKKLTEGVSKGSLIKWLKDNADQDIPADDFNTLVNNLWSVIEKENEERKFYKIGYKSIEEVDVPQLIDSSDNPVHDIGYRLLGWSDYNDYDDDIDEMLTESNDNDNFLKQIRETTKSYARITASEYGIRLVSLEDDLASYINRDRFNKYIEDCLNNNMSIDDIIDDIPWEKTISVHHAFEAEEYNQDKRRLNREYGFTKERTKSNRTKDTTPKLTFTELKKQNAEIVPYIKECVSLLEPLTYTKSVKVLSKDCCIVVVTTTSSSGLQSIEKTIQPLAKRFPGDISVTWGKDCSDWRLSRFNIKMTLTEESSSDYDDDVDGMLTESELTDREKLMKTFPDLDIRSGKSYLKEDMSDTVRDFVVNNIQLIDKGDFETVCKKADETLTTEQVYEFLDILKGAGIVTIKYNPNADVYEDEQMFEIDYSSMPETEPVKTQPEYDTPKQSYSNETQKNVPSEPTELSYEQLKDEYPRSVVKGVNTYIKDNEDLLKTNVLTFFNNALKKFPYKDFIDTLVYTVVNKLKINIFDIKKYNIPSLIAKQYKERYKNISAKIDAEHAKEEEAKKKLILKDINSGDISDLRYLQLIKYEDTLLKIIYKNKLAYKAYPFDIGMDDSYQKRLNSKTAVLLTVRGKVHVYMLFVGKTESDLKQIIARSKIKTEPYDSINDTRKYYSGPVGEIPGYSTGGGVKDTTGVKSASVSYNDLLKYGHTDRRDNYQYKYNNQDYWEND